MSTSKDRINQVRPGNEEPKVPTIYLDANGVIPSLPGTPDLPIAANQVGPSRAKGEEFEDYKSPRAEDSYLEPVKNFFREIKSGGSTKKKFVRALDNYGEQAEEYDPSEYQKTCSGAFCWLFWRLVFLALLVFNLYKLFTFQIIITTGSEIVWNINRHPNPDTSNYAQADVMMDVPTLDFVVQNNILFFEKDCPSLQRIDVLDLTGYNNEFYSKSESIPIAKGMYTSGSFSLNTWMPETSSFPSDEEHFSDNINDANFDSSTHTFDESLKLFYKDGHVFTEFETFVNHSAVLFVRFNSEQLIDLKMCQLQAALYNIGVMESLKEAEMADERTYQTPDLFPGLATSDHTLAPSSFDTENEDWLFKYADRNLLVVKSRLDEATLRQFATSESWGEYKANISSVASLEFDYESQGVHLDDFMNWGFGINYLNNFKYSFDNITCDGDSQFNVAFAAAKPINKTSTVLEVYGRPAFDMLTPFEVLLSGAVDQEQVTILSPGTYNPATGITTFHIERDPRAIDFHWTADPFECKSDNFPDAAPDSWICDTSMYWANDGCDCDCGAYDPDCCLQVDPDMYNCRNYEQCSPAGNCVTYSVKNTTAIFLSEACETVNYAGETTLLGYVGSVDIFESMSQGVCAACPADDFYDGNPQLDPASSTFMCNVDAKGEISGLRNIYELKNAGTSTNTSKIIVRNIGAPLPERHDAFPYAVLISDRSGVEETLQVLNATTVEYHIQEVTLTTTEGSKPTQRQVSYGKLYSACNTDSGDIVVIPHPLDPNPNDHGFSSNGPYPIRTLDTALSVIDSSESGRLPFQVLVLETKPSIDQGFITTLTRPAYRGDTTIYVEPFRFWYLSMLEGNGSFPDQFPILMRGLVDSFSGIEINTAVGFTAPNWTCDPLWYGSGDGCDCNCGIVDPDCAYPSPASYSGRVNDSSWQCTVNATACQSCPYCSSTGECTNTRWSATNLVSPPRSDFEMAIFLERPLMMDHDKGFEVETPVDIQTADGVYQDWYDNENDIYDVFTLLSIKIVTPEKPYDPADRHLPNEPETAKSPDPMQAEVALFMIPDRPKFSEAELCPGAISVRTDVPPVFDTNGWDQWQVKNGRGMEVGKCSMTPLTDDECIWAADHPKDQYNLHCIKEMPPTQLFSFEKRLPVNQKWEWPVQRSGVKNDPEYLIDVMGIYYFGHDREIEAVEDQFAENSKAGGDTDQTNKNYIFFGELFYRGTGSNLNMTRIPANVPTLKNAITIDLSEHAAQDAVDLKPSGWPKELGDIKTVLSKFPPLTIEFEFDNIGGSSEQQSVPLIPGLEYVLSAAVEVQPTYFRDMFGQLSIKSWTPKVSATSVSVRELDWFLRQECHVRYTIEISSSTTQLIESYAFDVKSFIDAMGSAGGIVGVGVILLSFWHKVTKTDKKLKEQKEAYENRKREEELRELQKKVETTSSSSTVPNTSYTAPTASSVAVPPEIRDLLSKYESTLQKYESRLREYEMSDVSRPEPAFNED